MATTAHRALTPRLVAVALAIGLVLAVASVPVGAVVMQHQSRIVPPLGTSPPMFSLAEYFQRDGHTVLVLRRDFWTGTIWESSVSPDPSVWTLRQAAGIFNARLATRDARPALVRAPLDGREHRRSALRAGWPLEAAGGMRGWSMGGPAVIGRGIAGVRAFGHAWELPYLPMWWGLLGNTLFYGAIALAVLAFVRHRKRSRRRAAGACVACGYELGEGVVVCPECGLAEER